MVKLLTHHAPRLCTAPPTTWSSSRLRPTCHRLCCRPCCISATAAVATLAQSDSPLGYGSEFKPIETLELIFENHPSWRRMKRILTHGSKWPLQPLDKENRIKDVEDALNFGNHTPRETRNRRLYSRIRNPSSTQQNRSNTGNSPRSSQHPSAEHHQRTRRDHSKKPAHT